MVSSVLQNWVRDSCIRDGRASRRLGLAVSKCPPYADEDMAINWRLGWRWEDERINKEKVNDQGL